MFFDADSGFETLLSILCYSYVFTVSNLGFLYTVAENQ